ncbi:MAG: hypothetical protein VB934_07070, partial [Polyangiaceae bacterium]
AGSLQPTPMSHPPLNEILAAITCGALLGLLASCGGKAIIDPPLDGAGSRCGEPNGPTLRACCDATCEQANLLCPDLDDACSCDNIADADPECQQPFAALYGCALTNPDVFACNDFAVEFRCGFCDAEIAALNTACNVGLKCVP